jgi:hypothetical protein
MSMDLVSHQKTVTCQQRVKCRVTGGADIVIRIVLPYLICESYPDSAFDLGSESDPDSNAASDSDESSDGDHAASVNDESNNEDIS